MADGGKAVWRALKTGLRNRRLIEVLEGTQPGNVVVMPADPRARLVEGRRVSVP
jgi:hypothetical protein